MSSNRGMDDNSGFYLVILAILACIAIGFFVVNGK